MCTTLSIIYTNHATLGALACISTSQFLPVQMMVVRAKLVLFHVHVLDQKFKQVRVESRSFAENAARFTQFYIYWIHRFHKILGKNITGIEYNIAGFPCGTFLVFARPNSVSDPTDRTASESFWNDNTIMCMYLL